MARAKKQPENLAIKNPNSAWVAKELEALYEEWVAWGEYVKTIQDHPIDQNRESEVLKDGRENLNKHDILREKTLAFLNNNIQGHNFIRSNEEHNPQEYSGFRLNIRISQRIHELDILRASLKYAIVPDSYWEEQGKKLVERIRHLAPEAAVKFAASWLKNPAGQE